MTAKEGKVGSAASKDLFTKIEGIAREAGAIKVGFADLSTLRPLTVGDPAVFEFPNAVSFAVEIPKEDVRKSMSSPSIEMRAAYGACNKRLKGAGERIQETLAAAGHKARFIDPSQRVVPEKLLGPISQKAVARLAGLGWIGKNGLLLIDGYGPRVRMATVLTDMPVPAAKLLENGCGDCTACIDNCPMRVLKGPPAFADYPPVRESVIDWAKCGEYEKKLLGDGTVPEKACGRCIAKCPKSWEG